MRILFDQGTPAPLRRELAEHSVDRGWATLQNGELLDAAEADGYELFVTTDQQLRYQQSLANRRIAILVLGSTSWPRIQQRIETIQTVIAATVPGGYVEVPI